MSLIPILGRGKRKKKEYVAPVPAPPPPPPSPLDPGTIAMGAVGSDSAAVTSTALASGGSGAISYQHHRSPTPGFTPGTGTAISGATGASHTHTAMGPGTYYFKRVATAGTASATSNEVSATVSGELSPGTIAVGTVDADTVAVTSTVPASGGTGPITYQHHRNPTPGFTPGGTTEVPGATGVGHTHTGLEPGDYYFKRVATDGTTTVVSNEVTATVLASLDPGTIAMGTVGTDSAEVTSTTLASGGSGTITYQHHRSITSGFIPDSTTSIAGATGAGHTHTALTSGTYYFVRVATAGAVSAVSNQVQATMSGSLSPGTISVGTAGTDSVEILNAAPASGGSGSISYQHHRSITAGFTPDGTTAIAGATTAAYTHTALATGTYYFKRVATDGTLSSTSNQVQATMSTALAPGSIKLGAGGTDSVTVSNFTLASGGAGPITYQHHRSTTSGFTPGTGTAISGATTASYTHTGLVPGTYYFVRVATDGTTSATSNQIQGTVSEQTAPGTSRAELPREYLDTSMPPTSNNVFLVPSGGGLQATIDQAAQLPDALIKVAPGTYTSRFTLPARSGSGWIVIQSDTALPPEGTRVTPASATNFAKLVGNYEKTLYAAPGAQRYRIIGLEITTNLATTLAQREVEYDETSNEMTIDRCYIHGHSELSMVRGVLFNCDRGAIIDSHIDECHTKGSDSQAVSSYKSLGPLKFVNNFLSGAGETLYIGGSSPTTRGEGVTADIEIRGNHLTKDPSWLLPDGSSRWTVKNILEFKFGKRALIEGNLLEHNWVDGQDGDAVNIKDLTSHATAVTEDITVRYNTLRYSDGGWQFANVNRLTFEQNFTTALRYYKGKGSVFSFSSGVRQATIRNNTMRDTNDATLLSASSALNPDIIVEDNAMQRGQYGWKSSSGDGTAALNGQFPNWVWNRNSIIIDPTDNLSTMTGRYPPSPQTQVTSNWDDVPAGRGQTGEAPPPADLSAGSIAVGAVTGTSVEITSSVAAGGGSGTITYQHHRSTTSGFTPGTGTAISGATGAGHTHTGLVVGTTYYFKRVATDGAADTATTSQVNATTSATLLPGTIAVGTVTGTSVEITSSAAASGGSGTPSYQHHRSTTSGFTPGTGTAVSGATSAAYTHTGLATGTTYYFKRVATDGTGSTATTSQVSALTASAPAAPSGLTASSVAAPVLNWVDNATTESGYYVHRSTSSGFTPVTATRLSADLGVNAITYTDSSAIASTTYYYKIEAYNATGPSYSAQASAATPASSGGGAGTVAIDSTSVGPATGTAATSTWSHTCSGTGRLLLVGVSVNPDSTTSVASVTYAGVALTYVGGATESIQSVELWQLADPPTGAASVVVTMPAAGAVLACGAISLTGSNATLGNVATAAGNATTLSTTLVSATDEIVFSVITIKTDTKTGTPGAGQTQRWNIANSTPATSGQRVRSQASTQTGAASTVSSWDIGGTSTRNMAMISVAIKPSAGGGGTTALFNDPFNGTALQPGYTTTGGGSHSVADGLLYTQAPTGVSDSYTVQRPGTYDLTGKKSRITLLDTTANGTAPTWRNDQFLLGGSSSYIGLIVGRSGDAAVGTKIKAVYTDLAGGYVEGGEVLYSPTAHRTLQVRFTATDAILEGVSSTNVVTTILTVPLANTNVSPASATYAMTKTVNQVAKSVAVQAVWDDLVIGE